MCMHAHTRLIIILFTENFIIHREFYYQPVCLIIATSCHKVKDLKLLIMHAHAHAKEFLAICSAVFNGFYLKRISHHFYQ